MINRFATSYQTINLVRNGGWDFVGSDGLPHFWTLVNLVAAADAPDSNKNYFEVGDDKISLVLHQEENAQIVQYFPKPGSMDFQQPLVGGVRSSLPPGYLVNEQQHLPAETYTVAFDLAGAADVRVGYGSVASTYTDWQTGDGRKLFVFTAEETLKHILIEVRRAADFVTVDLSRIMFAAGEFSALPYTGEPLNILPRGAIVMVCGDTCPLGFEELGETGATPKPEWASDDPGIRGRKGNYPRGGVDAYGDVRHTGGSILPGITDVQQFESFGGYLNTYFGYGQEEQGIVTGGDSKDFILSDFADVPEMDDVGLHTHVIGTAGTRPVSMKLRFCKRL